MRRWRAWGQRRRRLAGHVAFRDLVFGEQSYEPGTGLGQHGEGHSREHPVWREGLRNEPKEQGGETVRDEAPGPRDRVQEETAAAGDTAGGPGLEGQDHTVVTGGRDG